MKKKWVAAQTIIFAAIASLVGLTACTTYVVQRPPPPDVAVQPAPVEPAPPPPAYVEPTTVEVVIRDERDFYEPLTPYGHWENIGSNGRCWVPARVESDWRPYCNGHWERTDAGWYWVSDEPWGWATYHYGRWDFDPRFGWYWIPQTMWAPAWVSWHRGGGYVGWSPLPPSARIGRSGEIEVDTRAIPQRSYVFVEERRFLEPVRPKTVIVNNTTIINKTVNITKVKVVNKTVINEGPDTREIEQASGRKLRPVQARELRDKNEAPVVARRATQPTPPVAGTVAPGPSRTETEAERKAAERARQEKMQAERRAQEQQRKSQADAERVRAESERKAKMDTERQAQANRARVEAERRKAEMDRKAQVENDQRAHEQARQAQVEAARQKQIEATRAREQADREARQNQAQMEEGRRKAALDRKAEADAQAAERREEKKNQTEAERRAREQQKGKAQKKKATESQPATNAPAQPQ